MKSCNFLINIRCFTTALLLGEIILSKWKRTFLVELQQKHAVATPQAFTKLDIRELFLTSVDRTAHRSSSPLSCSARHMAMSWHSPSRLLRCVPLQSLFASCGLSACQCYNWPSLNAEQCNRCKISFWWCSRKTYQWKNKVSHHFHFRVVQYILDSPQWSQNLWKNCLEDNWPFISLQHVLL